MALNDNATAKDVQLDKDALKHEFYLYLIRNAAKSIYELQLFCEYFSDLERCRDMLELLRQASADAEEIASRLYAIEAVSCAGAAHDASLPAKLRAPTGVAGGGSAKISSTSPLVKHRPSASSATLTRGGIAWEVREIRNRSRYYLTHQTRASDMVSKLIERMRSEQAAASLDQGTDTALSPAVSPAGFVEQKSSESKGHASRDSSPTGSVHPSSVMEQLPSSAPEDKLLPTLLHFDARGQDAQQPRTSTLAVRSVMSTPPRASLSPVGMHVPTVTSTPRSCQKQSGALVSHAEPVDEASSFVMVLSQLAEDGPLWGDLLTNASQPTRRAVTDSGGLSHNAKRPTLPTKTPHSGPSRSPVSPRAGNAWHTRSLHMKLSSPERHRPSVQETAKKTEAKLATAEANREKIEEDRRKKILEHSVRSKSVYDWNAAKQREAGQCIAEKHEAAEARRTELLEARRLKADSEIQKVHEVHFINTVSAENKRAHLQNRLVNADRRKAGHLEKIRAGREEHSVRVAENIQLRRDAQLAQQHALRNAIDKRTTESESRRLTALRSRVGISVPTSTRTSAVSYACALGSGVRSSQVPPTLISNGPALDVTPTSNWSQPVKPAPSIATVPDATPAHPPLARKQPATTSILSPASPPRLRSPQYMDERTPLLHISKPAGETTHAQHTPPRVRRDAPSASALQRPTHGPEPVGAFGVGADAFVRADPASPLPITMAAAQSPTASPDAVHPATISGSVSGVPAPQATHPMVSTQASTAAPVAGENKTAAQAKLARKRKLKKLRGALEESAALVSATLPVCATLEPVDSLPSHLSKVLQALRREPMAKNAEGVPTFKSSAQKGAVMDLAAILRAPTSKDGKRLRNAGGVVLDPIQFAISFLDRESFAKASARASAPDLLASCVAWDGHPEAFSVDVRAVYAKCNAPRIAINENLLDKVSADFITGCASAIHRDALPSHPEVVSAALSILTVACTTPVGICRVAGASALSNVVDCFVASVAALDARWPVRSAAAGAPSSARVLEVPPMAMPLDPAANGNTAMFYHLVYVCSRALELLWLFLVKGFSSSVGEVALNSSVSGTVAYLISAGGADAIASVLKHLRLQDAGNFLRMADLVRVALAMQELLTRYMNLGLEAAVDVSEECWLPSAAESSMFEAPSIALSLLTSRDTASDIGGRDRIFHPSLCTTLIACFRTMNSYAETNPTSFQAGLTSVGNHMVIRNVIDEALRMAAPGSSAVEDVSQPALFDMLMREVLRLVCHYAAGSPRNRDSLNWGTQPTTLQRLCELPFRYFSEPRFRRLLFPALIIATNDSPANIAVVSAHLSLTMLMDFKTMCERQPTSADAMELACCLAREKWAAFFGSVTS